jgi:secreted PhoX family phosphatase
MKNDVLLAILFVNIFCGFLSAQHISEFISLEPAIQDTDLFLPSTHSFQYIIETGDLLTQRGTVPDDLDFTGYVPINNSSKMGYLSINSEDNPGGVIILDIELNQENGEWIVNRSEAVDFSSFALIYPGTIANCSGTVTPWNTIISCEEVTSYDTEDYCETNSGSLECLFYSKDTNNDGYYDHGWSIEIDPVTKTVIDQDGGRDGPDKLWAMGNFKHENVAIHSNNMTVYQGADDTNGEGYLFKFVADNQENLSAGDLYVYKGDKQDNGNWIQVNNSTISEQNTTLDQCAVLGATSFGGIEDVEINPIDGLIYFAVKREDIGAGIERGVVYRFDDSNPLDGTANVAIEIYVGGDVNYDGVPWGNGTDNLVFDNLGNLWVAQDESGVDPRNYIWLVENGHTQNNPKVKIFARTPKGSEPTGLTFSPDYRYLFLSIQHPDENNSVTSQLDGYGIPRSFDKDVSIMIARKEFINQDLTTLSVSDEAKRYFNLYPNPAEDKINIVFDQIVDVKDLQLFDIKGKKIQTSSYGVSPSIEIRTDQLSNGVYFLKLLIDHNWIVEKILISK